MWWAGPEPADIFLGMSCCGVRSSDGQTHWTSTRSPTDGWREATRVLTDAEAKRRARIGTRVWLSAALAPPFVMPPVPGIASAREFDEVSQRLCRDLTGLGGPCRIWIDHAAQEGARLAVAVEEALMGELESGGQRLNPQSVRPWWCEPLNMVWPKASLPAAVAIDDGDSLVLLTASRGIEAASVYQRAASGQVRALVTRTAMLRGSSARSSVFVARENGSAMLDLVPEPLDGVVFGAGWVRMP